MKIDKETVTRWAAMSSDWLSENIEGLKVEAVATGRDAWTIAHRSGITAEAYRDRDVVDAHIQTALERIFPNAIFRDKKAY